MQSLPEMRVSGDSRQLLGGSNALHHLIAELQRVFQEADKLGLQVLAAEASLHLGEALGRSRQFVPGRQALERAVTTGERLGLKPLLARAHHLLAAGLAVAGNRPEAIRHEAEARRLLEELKKEAGSDGFLARADFAEIAAGPGQRGARPATALGERGRPAGDAPIGGRAGVPPGTAPGERGQRPPIGGPGGRIGRRGAGGVR